MEIPIAEILETLLAGVLLFVVLDFAWFILSYNATRKREPWLLTFLQAESSALKDTTATVARPSTNTPSIPPDAQGSPEKLQTEKISDLLKWIMLLCVVAIMYFAGILLQAVAKDLSHRRFLIPSQDSLRGDVFHDEQFDRKPLYENIIGKGGPDDVKRVYYRAKNRVYREKPYFEDLTRIQHEVDFLRGMWCCSLLGFIFAFLAIARPALCKAARTRQYVHTLIGYGVTFAVICILAGVAWKSKATDLDKRVFGYFLSLSEDPSKASQE